MIVVINSIRLKSLRHFFRLTWNGAKIQFQAKKQPGFIKMKNTGFGYLHYTMSLWKNEEAIKQFVHSGAHQKAMQISKQIASELKTYRCEADALLTWKEAKSLFDTD